MFADMASNQMLSGKLVRLLEGVRIAENMTYADFVTHFDITGMSYYRWRDAAKNGRPINIPLATVQKGLDSLGYDAYIIISKSERK